MALHDQDEVGVGVLVRLNVGLPRDETNRAAWKHNTSIRPANELAGFQKPKRMLTNHRYE
jgi:hypothetical protein